MDTVTDSAITGQHGWIFIVQWENAAYQLYRTSCIWSPAIKTKTLAHMPQSLCLPSGIGLKTVVTAWSCYQHWWHEPMNSPKRSKDE